MAYCNYEAGEYFDVGKVKCLNCSEDPYGSSRNEGKVPSTTDVDNTGNSFSCQCSTGIKRVSLGCSNEEESSGTCVGYACEDCTVDGKAASFDQSMCIPCGSTTLGLGNVDCQCPTDSSGGLYSLVEKDAGGNVLSEKACVECATGLRVISQAENIAGVVYPADLYTCRSCPSLNMSFTVDGTCECDEGFTRLGVNVIGPSTCISTEKVDAVSLWLPSDSSRAEFTELLGSSKPVSTLQVSSVIMEHMLHKAGALCYTYLGPEENSECQVLGNLCLLHHLDPDAAACDLFNEILSRRKVVEGGRNVGWGNTLPWLLYNEVSADEVASGTDIDMNVSFKTVLDLKVAKYSLEGEYLGMAPLSTYPFYCGQSPPETGSGGGTSRSTEWMQFGHSTSETFSCDLSLLLKEPQVFYELYLTDSSSGEMVPVPVRNANLRVGSKRPNINSNPSDEEDDIFSHRFFWFDVASGFTDDTTSGTPSILRYASKMYLKIPLRKGEEKIFQPILEISYADIEPAVWETAPDLQFPRIEFTVEYTMDIVKFWDTLQPFFVVGVVLVGLIAAWRVRCWSNRNTRSDGSRPLNLQYATIDWKFLFHALLFFLHTYVLVMFPFTFAVCGYWFVFFKLQDSAFLLLPTYHYGRSSRDYTPILFMINSLFVAQLLRVLRTTYIQCSTDVVLLDWEKRSSKMGRSGVSVWRKILIANEWNELQAVRRVSIGFTSIWIAFILVGQGLQYNATSQPNLQDRSPGDMNPVLRFANTTFWWLLLSGIQLLWKKGIHERYFGEPPEQKFMDLATVAKISVLLLDEKYHGWYLHCRSPYPQSDVPMREISDQLNKESCGLTTDRGLEGCPKDVQSFEVFLSRLWRTKFDGIRSRLLRQKDVPLGVHNSKRAWRMGLRGQDDQQEREHMIASEKEEEVEQSLAIFIQGFIEQHYTRQELQREYRDVPRTDRLLGAPPDVCQQEKSPCVLYPDREYSFSSTIFLGIEMDLLFLDILAFAAFDLWFNSTSSSILLTYLLYRGIQWIRSHIGQINIAKKSLVDERFLV